MRWRVRCGAWHSTRSTGISACLCDAGGGGAARGVGRAGGARLRAGKPWVASVIFGAKSLEQLADNLAATTLRLTAEDMAALDAASALPPEYPGWMLAFQGNNRLPAAKAG